MKTRGKKPEPEIDPVGFLYVDRYGSGVVEAVRAFLESEDTRRAFGTPGINHDKLQAVIAAAKEEGREEARKETRPVPFDWAHLPPDIHASMATTREATLAAIRRMPYLGASRDTHAAAVRLLERLGFGFVSDDPRTLRVVSIARIETVDPLAVMQAMGVFLHHLSDCLGDFAKKSQKMEEVIRLRNEEEDALGRLLARALEKTARIADNARKLADAIDAGGGGGPSWGFEAPPKEKQP